MVLSPAEERPSQSEESTRPSGGARRSISASQIGRGESRKTDEKTARD